MPQHYDIVCLANSFKHGGRCIAGKVHSGEYAGRWIRPVGRTEGQRQIQLSEMEYARGQYAAVRDILRIEFTSREPNTFQSENLIISGTRWSKVGEVSLDAIADLLDTPAGLWTNYSRSHYSLNDKIERELLVGPRESLFLISPQNVRVRVGPEHNGDVKVRVLFQYNRVEYALTTTDVQIQNDYRGQPHATYPLPNSRGLTISLGERLPALIGDSYKLVAHVF